MGCLECLFEHERALSVEGCRRRFGRCFRGSVGHLVGRFVGRDPFGGDRLDLRLHSVRQRLAVSVEGVDVVLVGGDEGGGDLEDVVVVVTRVIDVAGREIVAGDGIQTSSYASRSMTSVSMRAMCLLLPPPPRGVAAGCGYIEYLF